MDPNEVSLENVSKLFEYEKIARDLDKIEDVDMLRNFAKCYAKLYMKQQEVIATFV